MTGGIITIIAAFVVSVIIAKLVQRFAPRLHLMDVPNARSSHHQPMPRGGGLAFVISFLAGLFALFYLKIISYHLLGAWVGGGVLIAFVGFMDDRQHVPAAIRLLIHVMAAMWVLWIFHGMPPLTIGFFTWHWHKIGTLVGILGLVWLINLYNFMDGIDGLAASEAIFVGLAAFLLLILLKHYDLAWATILLVACVMGFLLFNWPPARLFMGDTGSGFLGYAFGVLLVASASVDYQMLWQWVILLSVFWVDATGTLLRRIHRGEKWYQAHRTHAFQIAASHFKSHKAVVVAVLVINVVWLFPLLLVSLYYPFLSFPIVLLVLVSLMIVWRYFDKIESRQ